MTCHELSISKWNCGKAGEIYPLRQMNADVGSLVICAGCSGSWMMITLTLVGQMRLLKENAWDVEQPFK